MSITYEYFTEGKELFVGITETVEALQVVGVQRSSD